MSGAGHAYVGATIVESRYRVPYFSGVTGITIPVVVEPLNMFNMRDAGWQVGGVNGLGGPLCDLLRTISAEGLRALDSAFFASDPANTGCTAPSSPATHCTPKCT